MKEKYTIVITEENASIEIENGDVFDILYKLCYVMKEVVKAAPRSLCKDKAEQKNLIKAFCKAIMDQIDKEKEETPHVYQNQLS